MPFDCATPIRLRRLIRERGARRSGVVSTTLPIERLLPPRFLGGEKGAKPDEGGFAGLRDLRPMPSRGRASGFQVGIDHLKHPLIRLRHLLPHKKRGEKALDGESCDKSVRKAG